jgi:hypothetical protein
MSNPELGIAERLTRLEQDMRQSRDERAGVAPRSTWPWAPATLTQGFLANRWQRRDGTVFAPSNSTAPAVTGTTTVGQVLNCTTGTWTGAPTYAYQWQRGAVNIAGATAANYTLQAADNGAMIQCVVTATNVAGSTSIASNSVGPVT